MTLNEKLQNSKKIKTATFQQLSGISGEGTDLQAAGVKLETAVNGLMHQWSVFHGLQSIIHTVEL